MADRIYEMSKFMLKDIFEKKLKVSDPVETLTDDTFKEEYATTVELSEKDIPVTIYAEIKINCKFGKYTIFGKLGFKAEAMYPVNQDMVIYEAVADEENHLVDFQYKQGGVIDRENWLDLTAYFSGTIEEFCADLSRNLNDAYRSTLAEMNHLSE